MPDDIGVIVRTAAVGVQQDQLKSDVCFLQSIWQRLATGMGTAPTPSLLHHDLDMIQKTTQDLYTCDLDAIFIDDQAAFAKLSDFLAPSGSVDKLVLI